MERGRKVGSYLAQKIDEKKRVQESLGGHRTGLPDKLLRMFAPRPPLAPAPPLPRKPKRPYSGVASLVEHFAAPGDAEHQPPPEAPLQPEPRIFRSPELAWQARIEAPTKPEKQIIIASDRAARAAERRTAAAKSWDPTRDPSVQGDPFKTLFVGRLSFEVTERKLRRELEEFGPIKRIRLVHNRDTGLPKGYAFVEYEHTADMKSAYKMAEGRKVEGRRLLVDVERGRTVTGWQPRRLGGGKGGESRAPKPPKDPRRQLVARVVERAQAERERLRREGGRERSGDGDERGGGKEREKERSRSRAASEPREDGERPREREREERGRGDRESERDRKRERDRDDDRSSKRPRERDL